MNFSLITNNELDKIDLSRYKHKIKSLEYQNYFTAKSGQEHYRLLAYLSQSENDINILDIGTLKGCSALAFSINLKNNIYSFNLVNQLDLHDYPKNITFIINNILLDQYKNIILNSKYIMMDTDHDGNFENQFYNYLQFINYKGYLLLDDIYLNKPMINFWNSIKLEKYDISNIGHTTGTGVVYFK